MSLTKEQLEAIKPGSTKQPEIPDGMFARRFYPGDRVEIVAPDAGEGSAHEFHGYKGTVVEGGGQWIMVKTDLNRAHWPNPTSFVPHTVKRI